jgi:hypothetical protein
MRTGSGLDRGRAFYQAHPGLSMVVAAVPISEFDGGRRAEGNGLAREHATRKKCPVSWRAKVEHRGEGGSAIGSAGRRSSCQPPHQAQRDRGEEHQYHDAQDVGNQEGHHAAEGVA